MARPRKSPRNDFQKKINDLVSQSKEFKNIGEFCEAANITKEQYNNYQKTGANLPSTQVIKDMAKALRVDTAYLVGDTEYKNIAALQMNELSGLDSETCDVLLEISKSEPLKEIFEKIVLDENFIRLLSQTYRYSHSQNHKITIEDKAEIDDHPEIIDDSVIVSGIMKTSATSLFNKIIESIYESNTNESKNMMYYRYIESMFTNLHDLKPYYTDKQGKQKLYRYIQKQLDFIADINPNSHFIKLSPQTILENAEQFYNQIISE